MTALDLMATEDFRLRLVSDVGELVAGHIHDVLAQSQQSMSTDIGELFGALALAQGEITGESLLVDDEVKIRSEKASYDHRFLTLAGSYSAIRGPFSRHGLGVTMLVGIVEAGLEGPRLALTCVLGHQSGQWVKSLVPLPWCDKVQDTGSWLTYLKRYLLQGIAGVAAHEDDQAAERAKPQSETARAAFQPEKAKVMAEEPSWLEARTTTEVRPEPTYPTPHPVSITLLCPGCETLKPIVDPQSGLCPECQAAKKARLEAASAIIEASESPEAKQVEELRRTIGQKILDWDARTQLKSGGVAIKYVKAAAAAAFTPSNGWDRDCPDVKKMTVEESEFLDGWLQLQYEVEGNTFWDAVGLEKPS